MDNLLAAGYVKSDPPFLLNPCAIYYHGLIESYHRNSIGRILRTGSSFKASKWRVEWEVKLIYLIFEYLGGGKSVVDCNERLKKLIISVAYHAGNSICSRGRNQLDADVI